MGENQSRIALCQQPLQGAQRRMALFDIFSYFYYFVCFFVAMCDLVHDVDAILFYNRTISNPTVMMTVLLPVRFVQI